MLSGVEMNVVAIVLLALATVAKPLKPVRNTDLTVALNYQHELANSYDNPKAPYNVRVHKVITVIDECGGPISSCPDVDLYIAVSESDLRSEPALYKLPPAKGWKFVRWLTTCPSAPEEPKMGLLVRTTLPEANIDSEARDRWVDTEYEVCVSPRSATVVTKQHNNAL
jgi:hypothetical protein